MRDSRLLIARSVADWTLIIMVTCDFEVIDGMGWDGMWCSVEARRLRWDSFGVPKGKALVGFHCIALDTGASVLRMGGIHM
jgi:hypothetical protein